MIPIYLSKIKNILQAEFAESYQDMQIESISTDSRQSCINGLFFALKGENFDGHHYLAKAVEQGCIALVVDHPCDIAVPQLIVKDTALALGQLAAWLKQEINPKTVAITGSSGKTTVKEMTATILQQHAKPEEVLWTQGNFNNDLGVPLTLLRLTKKHKFAVVELGANHQGEIAYTTNLVKPDVALINNFASAHLEGFGSLEGVAQAKGEIFQGLKNDGIAILNQESNDYALWKNSLVGKKTEYFSIENKLADFYASNIQMQESRTVFTLHCPQGKTDICLPYLGRHNVNNALAATALAMAVGANLAQVKAGLEQPHQVKGRLFRINPCKNLLLLDDSYNANVDSLKSAIDVLKNIKAFRILVVGDMAELGTESKSCHQQVADYAQNAQLDLVISLGPESDVIATKCSGQAYLNKQMLIADLIPIIKHKLAKNQQVVVLAKGSRKMKMEDVIEQLKGSFEC